MGKSVAVSATSSTLVQDSRLKHTLSLTMAPQMRNRSRLGAAMVATAAGVATYMATQQGAFVPPAAVTQETETAQGRRESLLGAMGGAAMAIAPEVASAGPQRSETWVGVYTDPQHPNCKRILTVDWPGLIVSLQRGPGGAKACAPQGGGGDTVDLKTKFKTGSDTLEIDFSPV